MRTVKSEALRCVQQQDAAPADRKRLYPLERRFVPTPERSGTETTAAAVLLIFILAFCHTLLEGVYLPEASF